MSNEKLNYNWIVFKKALLSFVGKSQITEDDIFHEYFSFGEFIEFANRHRVMPQIADAFLRSNLPGTDRYCSYFLDQQQFHSLRQRLLLDEIVSLCALLQKNGVEVSVRKGVTIDQYAYGGRNIRFCNDIDFAANFSDLEAIQEILSKHTSYVPESFYFYVSQEIVKYPREAIGDYSKFRDHLPQFTRISEGPIEIPLKLDFAFSLSWADSEYPIKMDQAIQSRTAMNVQGHEVYSFDRIYSFIDAYMHLYREAYHKRVLVRSDRVSSFLDVWLLWEKSLNFEFSERERDLIAGYNIVAPLKWVAHHIDSIFESDMKQRIDSIFGDLPYELPENYYQSYKNESGDIREWIGDMDQRLMLSDRSKIFV